jgi:threonyl-tRNA synthetase
MRVQLPDGKEREVPTGSTFLDLAKSIGPGLAKAAIVARLDDELVDLQAVISREGRVQFLKADDPAAEDVIRHSCEHVLATAVLRLFPGAQVTMGPQDHSKDFYYDFDVGRAFTPEDLARIEAEMEKILGEDVPFVRRVVDKAEAARVFASYGQRFKPEILAWIKDDQVTLYQDADFVDLCRGPHVPSAGRIGAFKLLGAAGSYWRGDATRDQLQRIRGVAFGDKKKLAKHFEQLELAKARDHRKLGKDLELFGFSPLAPASPFFFPKGTVVYNLLIEYVRGLYRRYGYQEVVTPQIFSTDVWKTSGHYDNYADNMYFAQAGKITPHAHAAPAAGSIATSEEHPHGVEIAVKPMNCPGHCVLYGMQLKSFRELPWRVADFGRLHRAEGEAVHGMMRVRTFCQDDAHIFCTEDQMGGPRWTRSSRWSTRSTAPSACPTQDPLGHPAREAPRLRRAVGSGRGRAGSTRSTRGPPYTVAPARAPSTAPSWSFTSPTPSGARGSSAPSRWTSTSPSASAWSTWAPTTAPPPPGDAAPRHPGQPGALLSACTWSTPGALPAWLAPVQAGHRAVTDRHLEHADTLAAASAAGLRVDRRRRNDKLGAKIRRPPSSKCRTSGRGRQGGRAERRLRAPARRQRPRAHDV